MKVLIVETDDKFRDHLARRLAAKGFAVDATHDLDEARRMACEEAPEAILLGVSGFRLQALSFLEGLGRECPETRVIIVNPGDMSLSIAAMKQGAVDEVTVPVDMAELAAKLRAVGDGGGRD